MSHDFLPKTFSGYNAAMAPDGFIDGFLDAQAALDFADFQRGLAYSEYLRTGGVSVSLPAPPAAPRPRKRRPTLATVKRQAGEGRLPGRALRRSPTAISVVLGKPAATSTPTTRHHRTRVELDGRDHTELRQQLPRHSQRQDAPRIPAQGIQETC